MKKIGELLGFMLVCCSMQASWQEKREAEVARLFALPQGKALLWSIERGFDNILIANLLDNVTKKSSDKIVVAMIIQQAEEQFRIKSQRDIQLHIKALQAKMNCGATPGKLRGQLQKEVEFVHLYGRVPDESLLYKSKIR